MTTETRRPTFIEDVTMFDTPHTITAYNLDSKRCYGTRYEIRVDGIIVATATWRGGRRYWVKPTNQPQGWEYITESDGGKVSDVAHYFGVVAIHEARG